MWVSCVLFRLSLCDLAGSERCKDQKNGDRMKEANNINTSLHTLGRCIAALRQNQQSKWVPKIPEGGCREAVLFYGLTLVFLHRLKQTMVPFRDSKLTRVFQGFFTGRGRSCMIVNINQCASTYDETLYVAKFSAIASQVSSTDQDHGMVMTHLAALRVSPFPSQDRGNACKSSLCFSSGLLPLQYFQILLNWKSWQAAEKCCV